MVYTKRPKSDHYKSLLDNWKLYFDSVKNESCLNSFPGKKRKIISVMYSATKTHDASKEILLEQIRQIIIQNNFPTYENFMEIFSAQYFVS